MNEYAFAFIFLGAIITLIGIKEFKLKNTIQDLPTSKVRSLAVGFVELFGKIVPTMKKELLKSLFSEKNCVYYDCKIERYQSSKNGGHWITIFHEIKRLEFFLKDNTGSVLVNPNFAQLKLSPSFKLTTGFGKKLNDNLLRVMSEKKIHKWGQKRFTEYILTPDNEVYILGTTMINPDVNNALKNEDNLIIQKGNFNRMFLISDSNEKNFLKKTITNMILCFIFGIPTLIFGLFLLFTGV